MCGSSASGGGGGKDSLVCTGGDWRKIRNSSAAVSGRRRGATGTGCRNGVLVEKPGVEFVGKGEDVTALAARNAMNGETALVGPARNGTDVTSEVFGDFLPRIEARALGWCHGSIDLLAWLLGTSCL